LKNRHRPQVSSTFPPREDALDPHHNLSRAPRALRENPCGSWVTPLAQGR
jgi:hypothetical protein